ncbi:MAG: membrane protein insertase YidC [Victivallaceae bacterium]
MKLDKETIIIGIVALILVLSWEPLCRYMGWVPAAAPVAVAPAATAAPVLPAVTAATATPNAASAAASPAVPAASRTPAQTVCELPARTLTNSDLALEILPSAGAVAKVTLFKYRTADRKSDVVIDQLLSTAIAGKKLQPGALAVFTPGEEWHCLEVAANRKEGDDVYFLSRRLSGAGGEFLLTQSWKVADRGYRTEYSVTIANPGKTPLIFPRLVVSDGELNSWGEISGDHMRSDSLRLDYYTASGDFVDLAADAKDEAKFLKGGIEGVRWTSLSNKYFISILQGEEPFRLYQARVASPAKPAQFIAATGAEYANVTIAANSARTFKFSVYTGPKIVAELESFAPGANRTMHLAWGPLDYLARFLLWALIKLDHVFGSYGWSIVILTIIVRLLFWPVTARANASMKKMSAVQPKIQELREKYKDNPQILNQKTMELYRTEKINPLGGCFPILLQIPVFLALYSTLDGAVELRQVSFLWAHDLAAADTIARLPGFLFNLPVNPLVIAMTVLMVVQQKMTPSAMDPMQQKMMLLMPVVMLFFLYDLPSGLTLYWTVSQIFSILQLRLSQKFGLNAPVPATGTPDQKVKVKESTK